MNNGRKTLSRWPLILALGLLALAMATLLWLRGRLIAGQESLIEGTVRRFEATAVLGRPESNAIVFQDIETLAIASKSDFVQELFVTKVIRESGEVTVVPYYMDLTNPGWRQSREWIRLPIGEDPTGYLYIQTDNTTLNAVTASIVLLGLLLAGGLAILLLRQRGKEAQVNRLLIELQERKAQVLQLERLALAGQLSANVFHDIKKPVLNIKHEVADALDDERLNREEVLRLISEQTELFLQMLRDLGMEAFVSASSEETEWCDLEEAVEQSLRLVQYERGDISTDVEFEDGKEFLIKGLPYRFVQLFSNLFLNAYQAMGDTGTLRVRGSMTEKALSIIIEDSGPGIPEEKRLEIFSPFVTTRSDSGGSGLGLYITRTIIEDHGGSIIVEKGELGGARFCITLPAAS